MREEVRGEVEETRIRVEDMAAVYARLKNKVGSAAVLKKYYISHDIFRMSVRVLLFHCQALVCTLVPS